MNTDDNIDTQLVAFLHGELHGSERQAVVERLRHDADARERLALLESVDLAAGEALGRSEAPRPARPLTTALRPLLALAAVLVVTLVIVFGRDDGQPDDDQQDDVAAGPKNEFVELRVAPADGGTMPIFTDASLQFFWKNRDSHDPRRDLRVYPLPFGKTAAQLGQEVDRMTHIGSMRQATLPVVMTATIHGPDGIVLPARYAPDSERHFGSSEAEVRQQVMLRDFEVQLATPRPAFIGNPGKKQWEDDSKWAWSHMPKDKAARFFPEVPGDWRLELAIEPLPAPDYMPWPQFDAPLELAVTFRMTGKVSAWGEAHDGMVARLIWATGCADLNRTPMALQLRNDSRRDRKYNHVGTTIAKIPQPMHFTLHVDGTGWQQQDRVPLIIAAGDLGLPHPPGQVRTFVTRPGFWRGPEGKRLAQHPGEHRVKVLFHFEPSLWNAADRSIWLGRLWTGELVIEGMAPK